MTLHESKGTVLDRSWPYPRWVAHRGAGLIAPENTLAAFKCGFEAGFRMFECDVKLSADGTPFLLHDSTLDRTTDAKGQAHKLTWTDLQQLDAGAWHSPRFKGEKLLSLRELSNFCLDNECMLNIEIKPSPGFERITGARVAELALELWRYSPTRPLLSSFDTRCLLAAEAAAPVLPRALLVHKFSRRWRVKLADLNCNAVIFEQSMCNSNVIRELKSKGLRCGVYTVNEPLRARTLVGLGVELIITDNIDLPKLID